MIVVCFDCKIQTTVETIDEGIGPYEFWGALGNHTDFREVSTCCGSENVGETIMDALCGSCGELCETVEDEDDEELLVTECCGSVDFTSLDSDYSDHILDK